MAVPDDEVERSVTQSSKRPTKDEVPQQLAMF
jgi:hypothetical protein